MERTRTTAEPHDPSDGPPPIPPPSTSGTYATTPVPLAWARWAPSDPARAARPPLLLLHGGPGAHYDYLLPQCLALAEARPLLTYDQRGGGRSRTDDRTPIGWRTQVGDLGRVIAAEALEHPVLVGYSWGGLLAMLYAIEQARGMPFASDEGDAIALAAPRALVLIDPAPASAADRATMDGEFQRRQRDPALVAARAALAASDLKASDPAAFAQRTFELAVAPWFSAPSRARNLTPFRVTGRVQQSVWESLGAYDLRQALRAVDAPTLVVHGREDPIPVASSRDTADALGAELVVLEDCGHVPYVEQPAALFGAIERFLAGLP
jgi:proline iminopeptidase